MGKILFFRCCRFSPASQEENVRSASENSAIGVPLADSSKFFYTNLLTDELPYAQGSFKIGVNHHPKLLVLCQGYLILAKEETKRRRA